MRNSTKDVIVDALRRVYKHRREHHVGGLKNAFPTYLLNNLDGFDRLIEELDDEISQDLVRWFIQFRIINSFLLDKDATKACLDPLISEQHAATLNEEVKAHHAASLKSSLPVDIIENWLLEGYSLPGICEPEAGEVVLDCGAFNGNSSIYFAERVGEHGRVLAFEPDPSTVVDLRENISRYADKAFGSIEVHNLALSSTPGELRFSKHGAASHVDPKGNVVVDSKPIDTIVAELELSRIDLIKMDVEGFEKQALAGAVKTIRRHRPKLMICIYHLAMDIVEIPKIIREISPWYKFYVRHHATHDGELVLYCKPVFHHQHQRAP